MALSREIVDQVRERSDIVEVISRVVTLKRSGRGYLGLCPFHHEKTPSFHVEPSRGIFHCFGCGEGGDVIKFVMKTRGLGFGEALKELAAALGIRVEDRELTPDEQQRVKARRGLHEACEEAARFYQSILLVRPEGAAGRAYLEKRGIREETVQRFRLGYAPAGWTPLLDHLQARSFPTELLLQAGLARPSERGGYDTFRERIMFPILDTQDRVVSFGGRLVADSESREGDGRSPKYLNGPETDIYSKSSMLFGLPQARTSMQRRDRALLVEGYFDVVTLSQAGFEEAIATCGTALTEAHAALLRRLTRNVIALFDADEAGQRAAVRSLPMFAAAGIEAHRLQIEGAKDPDELIREKGPQAFEDHLSHTIPLMEMVIRWTGERVRTTAGGKQKAVEQLAPLLPHFAPVARAAWTRRIAEYFNLPEASIRVAPRSQAPPADPARAPPPSLGVLPMEVRHILWLLLHHGDQAAPILRRADPAIFGDRADVKIVLAGLINGQDPREILEKQAPGDLTHLLSRLMVESEPLYEPSKVESGLRQNLATLEMRGVKEQLDLLGQEISTLEFPRDMDRFNEVAMQRDMLQRRLQELKSIRCGAASTRH
jgi:DNA primase